MRRGIVHALAAALLAAAGAAAAFGIVRVQGSRAAASYTLEGQWHLDAAQTDFGARSSTTPDSSGHADDLAIGSTSPPLVPGRFGNGLDLSQYAAVRPTQTGDFQVGNVAVVAWVKRSGSPGQYRYLVGMGARGCTNASYALYTGSGGGLVFYIDAGASVVTSPAASPGAVWDGQWHMVAGTFDGSAVRLYLDGHQVGSGTSSSGPIAYGSATSYPFALGLFPGSLSDDSCSTYPWDGAIDEVRVYGGTLSDADLLYLGTAGGATPPDLPPPTSTTTAPTTATTKTAPATTATVPTTTTTTTPSSAPSARLAVSKTKAGQLLVDASGSTASGSRISGYTFDFGGGPAGVINCGPDSPVAAPLFAGPLAGSASVIVTAANGLSSTARVAVTSPGIASQKAHPAPRGAQPIVASQCLPKGGALGGDYVPDAGGRKISSACEVDAGLVQADGCGLKPFYDLCNDVPAAERTLLLTHVKKGKFDLLATPACPNADRTTSGIGDIAPARATHLVDVYYVSKEAIRVNGVDVVPVGGSSIVLAVGARTGATSRS